MSHYAIRCFEHPFGSEHEYTCSGMRTEVVEFQTKAKRDTWAGKESVWPESFRQAVEPDFVVRSPAEHENIYVREAA